MRPYARYPTGFPVGFFLLFIFLGGGARRAQAEVVCKSCNTRETRIASCGGGWVGPKGTSTTSGCVRQYAPIISHNNV